MKSVYSLSNKVLWQSRRRTTEEKRLEGAVRSEIMAERTKLSDMLTREKG